MTLGIELCKIQSVKKAAHKVDVSFTVSDKEDTTKPAVSMKNTRKTWTLSYFCVIIVTGLS